MKGRRRLKAWIAQETETWSNATIVFAETRGKARSVAMHTDACEDVSFIEIYIRRVPQMDKYYRGLSEMDWFDPDDRIAMVRDAGFSCTYELDKSDLDCDKCPACKWCDRA